VVRGLVSPDCHALQKFVANRAGGGVVLIDAVAPPLWAGFAEEHP
jgi:hypothetical protein